MPSGGYRAKAGRPPKSAMEKVLEGNRGKRPIKVVDFEDGIELPRTPPASLSSKGKEIYSFVYEWLEKIGCLKGIMPYHLEEYATNKAWWYECEANITKIGLVIRDSKGNPMRSPYVDMAKDFLRTANEAWGKIYVVVREVKLKEWDSASPNDDIMEKLLSGKM